MPYPNEHAARLTDPGKYTHFARENNKGGDGVDFIFGIKDGESELQAIRFKKNKFTESEARTWLKDNDKSPIEFDPASGSTDSAERVVRFDVSNIPHTQKTPEGFLRTDSIVTRTGIFIYRNPDGTTRREFRDHRQVFDSMSIDSMKMIPITLNHPNTDSKLLDATNAKKFQIGFTGENVRADGENVRVPITITDAAAVSAVEQGKRGLSLGYDCDLVEEKGHYDGMEYDARQENIRYNHLAIVDIARAGANAQIKLDSADAFFIDNSVQPLQNERTANMPKIRIDGIEYEASQEVINFLTKETARADSAAAEIKTLKTTSDTATAERDTFKARVDVLEVEKAKVPELVVAAVAGRLDLERKANVVLDGEDVSKLADKEIKTKIITKIFPDAKLDGVSDDYLNARVDSAIETLDTEKREIALGKQRQASSPVEHTDEFEKGEPNVEESEKRYRKNTTDAWKTKKDGCKKDEDEGAVGSIRKK